MMSRLKFLFWRKEWLVVGAIVVALFGLRVSTTQAVLIEGCSPDPCPPNPSIGTMTETISPLMVRVDFRLENGTDPVEFRLYCNNGQNSYWTGWYNTPQNTWDLCSYDVAGTYSITVSIRDSDGRVGSKTHNGIVVPPAGQPACAPNAYQCGNCLDDDGDGTRDFAFPNGGGALDLGCNAANDDWEGPTTPYFHVIVTSNVDPAGFQADWMTNLSSGPRYKNPAYQYLEGPYGTPPKWDWKTIVEINGQGSVTTNPINIPAGWTYETLQPWHNNTQNYSGRAADSPLRWEFQYNTGTPTPPPPPPVTTLNSVTISSPIVVANNVTQYNIVVTSTDTGGAASVIAQYALINYQGENAGAHRGYPTMYYPGVSNPWPGAKNPMACTGGGWGAIQLGYGDSYMNLVSCTVSTVGNVRTTTFTVRFDTSYTTPTTNNDISGYTVGSTTVGWTNFDLNFALATTTLNSVTISPTPVSPNNIAQYNVVVTSTDTAGAASIIAQYALINYQGENAGAYRGYLTMYYPGASNPWPAAKNPIACTGGGWGAIQLNYGPTFLNLDTCTVTTVGNIRTTTFKVRFDPSFTTPTADNDISGYTTGSGGAVGWTNFQTDFALANVAPTASQVKATEPDYCTAINVPSSITASWTYSDPEGTTQSAYQVQVDDDPLFGSPNFNSGKLLGSTLSYPVPSGLTWGGTYRVRVMVWDGGDLPSVWTNQTLCQGPGCIGGAAWDSPEHAYPDNTETFTWTPAKPIMGTPMQFDDGSTLCLIATGVPIPCAYLWDFGDSTTSSEQNPLHTYGSNGAFDVNLRATDYNGYSCNTTKPVNIQKPVPFWREVLPW